MRTHLLAVWLMVFVASPGCLESNPQPSPFGSPDHQEGKLGDVDTSTGVDEPADALLPSGEWCAAAIPIACGDTVSHDTAVHGRPNEWFGYNCSARAESGPEVLYVFHAQTMGPVTVTLGNLEQDLDLFLLTQCDPFTCIEFASTPLDIQKGQESVTFLAMADTTYFLAVDGYAEAQGSYDLAVSCSPLPGPLPFAGGIWQLQVDRQLKEIPPDVTFPSDPLEEED